MLRRGDRFGGVESPLQLLQLSPLHQTRQVIAWNTGLFEILRAHNVLPPNQIRQPACLGLIPNSRFDSARTFFALGIRFSTAV